MPPHPPHASPDDDDLDADLTGLAITAVVDMDQRILARARGGHGYLADGDGGRNHFQGQGDFTFTIQMASAPAMLFNHYVTVLEQWRDSDTPVRLLCAPGRASLLTDPDGRALVLPRR